MGTGITSAAHEVGPPFRGVLFDLLRALLDSWSLWNQIAGSPATGQQLAC